MTEEKLYTRTVYTQGRQEIVKATSPEEAKEKFINGHADVVSGMIVVKNEKLYNQIRLVLNVSGGTMDPHQGWLVLRGVRTLALRMEKSQENAARLAEFLAVHPKVTWVNYPGLAKHPQHEIAKKQMKMGGNIVVFEIKGGIDAGRKFLNNIKMCSLSANLGDTRTIVTHPSSTTHGKLSREDLLEVGITDGLIRVSVGLESSNDIIYDLKQALENE